MGEGIIPEPLVGETVEVWRYAEYEDFGAREADDYSVHFYVVDELTCRALDPGPGMVASRDKVLVPFGSAEHENAIRNEYRGRY